MKLIYFAFTCLFLALTPRSVASSSRKLSPPIETASLLSDFLPLIKGEWFDKETQSWSLSFFDSLAIYKSNIWKYKSMHYKDEKILITINRGKAEAQLTLSKDKSGNYLLRGPEKEKFIKSFTRRSHAHSSEEFDLKDVFGYDSTTYKGYIVGYSPKSGFRTGQVIVPNVFTGKLDAYLIKIGEDGSFTAKFPMFHATEVFVRLPGYSTMIFCSPRSDLFHRIGTPESNFTNLFMGELAHINQELLELNDKKKIDFKQIYENSFHLDLISYKSYFNNVSLKQFQIANEYKSQTGLCRKVEQLVNMDITYYEFEKLLSYRLNLKSASQVSPSVSSLQSRNQYQSLLITTALSRKKH